MEQEPVDQLLKPPHVCYYSKKSNPSMKFVTYLKNYPEISMLFKLICVDSEQLEHKIRSVPALILDNGQIHYGKKAFEHIEEQSKMVLDGFDNYQGFSMVDNSGNDLGYQNYTFLNDKHEIQNVSENTVHKQNSSIIDNLIEKRKSEIPQPIQRV